jgi:FkbM family methyltransferase
MRDKARFPLTLERVSGHSYIPPAPGSVVLDLGVNKGAFSRHIAEAYGARILGLEPIKDLHRHSAGIPGLTLVHAAAGGRDGETEIHVLDRGCPSMMVRGANVERTETVRMMSFASILAAAGAPRIALAKVDIEGAELDMFEQASDEDIRRVDQFTVEFHGFIYAEQWPRIERVKARLRGLGYRILNMSPRHLDLLFVRAELMHPLAAAYLGSVYKYAVGGTRWAGNRLKRAGGRRIAG